MDLRVAIVDDDPRDREALEAGIRATASAEGVRCSLRSYAGADEMLAVFAPGSLDLAFLDVLMVAHALEFAMAVPAAAMALAPVRSHLRVPEGRAHALAALCLVILVAAGAAICTAARSDDNGR